jgi:hypothetical protein
VKYPGQAAWSRDEVGGKAYTILDVLAVTTGSRCDVQCYVPACVIDSVLASEYQGLPGARCTNCKD